MRKKKKDSASLVEDLSTEERKGGLFTPSVNKGVPDASNSIGIVYHSGSLLDQRLKHGELDQTSLLSQLSKEEQDQELINKLKSHIEQFDIKREGVTLNQAEQQTVITLLGLLHDLSANNDLNSPFIYRGNCPHPPEIMFGKEIITGSKLVVSVGEYCKAYYGNNNYGRDSITSAVKTLVGLSQKMFYFRINRRVKGKNGRLETDRISGVQPLISVTRISLGLSDSELQEAEENGLFSRSKGEKLAIEFHPIFFVDLKTNFVRMPRNLPRRIREAYSPQAKSAPNSVHQLINWLIRAQGRKNLKPEANEETLISFMELNNYMKEGRKGKVTKAIEKAIETAKQMGILFEVNLEKGKEGQKKYVFKINPNFS